MPTGAPVTPPVPSGFSPAGVMAATDPVRKSLALKVAAGGVLAAGIAAGVAIGGSDTPHESFNPGADRTSMFSIDSISPVAGSIVSLSAGRVGVTLRVGGTARAPLEFSWRFELSSNTAPCVVMAGEARLGQDQRRPVLVVLAAPLMPTGACRTPFDIEPSLLTIRIGGEIVYEQAVSRRFRFEP